jgi:hypothetical protein
MEDTKPTICQINEANWLQVQGWAKQYIPTKCRPRGGNYYRKPKLVELLCQHFGYIAETVPASRKRIRPDQLADMACFADSCFNPAGYGKAEQMKRVARWGDQYNRMACYAKWEVSCQ